MKIKLIIGLANPGKKYVLTRHNIGSWYVFSLAKHLHISFKKEEKFLGYISNISLSGINIYLFVPNIFINLSGEAVVKIADFYRINSNEILIAHDELNLPLGVAKIKFGGSHGGHNGLKDIIRKLNNNTDFYRLRIGIGHPGDKNKVIDFILGQPTESEKNLIDQVIHEAIDFTEAFLKNNKKKITDFHTTLSQK